jgi:hypothetical protein
MLGDAALPAGLICLGVPEDHEAAIGLRKLGVVLRGNVWWFTSLGGRLLVLSLLAEGAADVAPDGGTVFQEVLCQSSMEWTGGLDRLLEALGACAAPAGLRPRGVVGRDHHLLPTALLILVPLLTVALGRGGVVAAVSTTEVTGGL